MIVIVEKRENLHPVMSSHKRCVFENIPYIYMYIYWPPSSEHSYEAHLGHTCMGDVSMERYKWSTYGVVLLCKETFGEKL